MKERSLPIIRAILGLGERVHLYLKFTEHSYMVLVAIVVGLLGGLGAVGFRKIIRVFQTVAWQTDNVTLDYLAGLPIWWKILAPTVGGLIVGLIIVRVAAETKGHGVPEVMEAVALQGGRIRPRVVFAKLLASGVCIASGGSVGREGPIVQIGSAIGSSIGQWLRVGERRLRTLVGCGAAAGIAATFNAPVAGALFAVEIILGDFGVTQFSPIVISSVTATVVENGRLVGALWPLDVIESYNSEILKRDMASTMASTIGSGPSSRAMPGVRGMNMAEIPVPASFFGRSLGSLDIRNRYGVSLLLIKRKIGGGERIVDEVPSAEYVFQEGDVMLALGNEQRLERFERAG